MSDRSGHDAGRGRARNIATGARSLPEALRPRFVESACAGDEALLAEVRSLLGWEPEAPPASAGAEPGAAPAAAPPPPDLEADLLHEEPSAAAEEPTAPADEPTAPADVDRALDAAFREPDASDEGVAWSAPAPGLPHALPPAEPRRRSFPFVALLATAAAVWLGFIAVTLSKEASRANAERDRAMLEEAKTRGEVAGVEENARRAAVERDFLTGLLATEASDTLWRDRIAMGRFLDRAVLLVRADPTLDDAARGRLLAAFASGYRARGFVDRADSIALEADSLRGGAPAAGAP